MYLPGIATVAGAERERLSLEVVQLFAEYLRETFLYFLDIDTSERLFQVRMIMLWKFDGARKKAASTLNLPCFP